MAPRKTTSVDHVYSHGRTFPHGRVRDEGAQHRIAHDPARYHDHNEVQAPQAPENSHGPSYSNDVPHSWLTGGGGDGMKPTFDRGNSWRRADKGNDWGSGSDPAIIRKPEPNKP